MNALMSASKIVSVEELARHAGLFRQNGRSLVFTNGCFDLLHVGHVRYLQAARREGDALVVALNADTSVRALKGDSRPINTEQDRAEIVAALACVDWVTIFDTPRVDSLVREVRPAVYVKGGDYTLETLDPGERRALEEVGAQVKIVPLVPGRSTTSVVARLSAAPPQLA